MLKIMVPATTANIGPGFDCLGMALELYNTLEIASSDEGTHIQVYGEGADRLPCSENNLIYRALARSYEELNSPPPPRQLKMTNGIPLARGLGSSAAAIVAGLLAAHQLTGQVLPRERVLDLAVELEGHPDNVAPALLGGLVISAAKSDGPGYHYLQLPPPRELQAVVCIPDFLVATEDARRVLPSQVAFSDAVHNLGRVALLLGAFRSERWDLLPAALEDRLHQPYRKGLVPGLDQALTQARKAGALGAALSGSGPTIVAFVKDNAARVGRAMEEAFACVDIAAHSLVLDFNAGGAKVQEST
ncbi:MAG: homoserine kinase [bacterium]